MITRYCLKHDPGVASTVENGRASARQSNYSTPISQVNSWGVGGAVSSNKTPLIKVQDSK